MSPVFPLELHIAHHNYKDTGEEKSIRIMRGHAMQKIALKMAWLQGNSAPCGPAENCWLPQ